MFVCFFLTPYFIYFLCAPKYHHHPHFPVGISAFFGDEHRESIQTHYFILYLKADFLLKNYIEGEKAVGMSPLVSGDRLSFLSSEIVHSSSVCGMQKTPKKVRTTL